MPDTGHFHLTRSFALPPDRLWHLLTDAQSRETWGAPSDDHVLVVDAADTREGGWDRHRCGPREAPDYTVDTHWYHLDAPARACFTETLSFGGARASVTLASYTLTATGSGTDLRVDVLLTALVEDATMAEHEFGWNAGLDRLVRLAHA